MTIERSNANGWGIGEMVTSAQLNATDALHEAAIDKRSGKQDIFMSMLVATGAGRVLATVQTGPDAAATFHVQDGVSIVRVPTLTAARAYTLGHTGATGGDRIVFALHGTGQSPSGYVDIKNTSGTGLYRLGRVTGTIPNDSAQGERAEFIFGPDGQWQLFGNARSTTRRRTFTTTTTWTCPPGVFEILLEGCGGGGGGAGGYKAPASTFGMGTGGGGGGGATRYFHRQEVTPGVTYTITIGTGGAGGAGSGTIPTAGTAGGDSTFAIQGGAVLKRFPGADGGKPGVFVQSAGVVYAGLAHGGGTIKSMTTTGPTGMAIPSGFFGFTVVAAREPGRGGFSIGFAPGFTQIAQPLINAGIHWGIGNNGYTGGAPGSFGLESSHYGGAGGGGGGGGAFGNGGAGGAGGDGASAPGNGVAGSDGTTAAEFSGAGGGGGGAGGGDTTPPNGGAGGNGGSGRIDISW